MKLRLTSPTVVSTDDTDSGSELESVVHDMGLVASSGDEDDDGKPKNNNNKNNLTVIVWLLKSLT